MFLLFFSAGHCANYPLALWIFYPVRQPCADPPEPQPALNPTPALRGTSQVITLCNPPQPAYPASFQPSFIFHKRRPLTCARSLFLFFFFVWGLKTCQSPCRFQSVLFYNFGIKTRKTRLKSKQESNNLT